MRINFKKATLAYRQLRNEQYALYNRAISATIELYGLVPRVTNQGDSGIPAREPARNWAPRFMEQKHYDPKIHRWVLEEDYDARGITMDDGRVRILPNGVDSADMLAQTIYHETAHWLDRVVAGQPLGVVDRWRGEVVAYDAVLGKGERFNIGSESAGELRLLREQYQYQVNHPDRQGHDGRKWLRYDGGATRIADDADVDDDDLADPINDIVEQTVRERRQAAEQRRSDLALKDSLGAIARRVCADPDSVTQSDLDALPAASPDFNAVVWPPPRGLGKCGDELYFTLCMVVEDSALDLVKVREHYKPHPVEPPIPVLRPAPMIPQSVAIPELIRLACDSPSSLSQEVFDRYLPSYMVIPGSVAECSQPQPGRSACFLAVLQRVCQAGPAAMRLQSLLSTARSEEERVSRSNPPSGLPDDGYVEKPERQPPDDRCFQDPGSPRGCR